MTGKEALKHFWVPLLLLQTAVGNALGLVMGVADPRTDWWMLLILCAWGASNLTAKLYHFRAREPGPQLPENIYMDILWYGRFGLGWVFFGGLVFLPIIDDNSTLNSGWIALPIMLWLLSFFAFLGANDTWRRDNGFEPRPNQ